MQPPPLDLTTPDTVRSESGRNRDDVGLLVIVTILVTLAAFIVLSLVNNAHAYHGDRAATPEFMACSQAAFDDAMATGTVYDADACKPVMPWYAAHPGWYALAIGGAVLIVGRLYLFMRRMEETHGR